MGRSEAEAAGLEVLRRVFGYSAFRGHQAAVIEHVISGGDALVLMPTGGGKSLCFQVPALVRPGVALVVSPLIALMRNQVDALCQLGVRAAYLNSTLDWRAAAEIERAVVAGELDLLYVAPERLLTPRCLELLQRSQLSLIALDEAHCVSQWGHDFRPEYLQLGQLGERFPGVPRIALTATADPRTRSDILAQLGLSHAQVFLSSFDRPNLSYRIIPKSSAKEQLLRFIREEHPEDAGIVYCLSRARVEETANWLVQRGHEALPYHAGLPPEVREANQDRFIKSEGLVMVATIAFGMGIDKPNVRFVAHLDAPRSLEAYYQETGRAGRDGLPADAWMTYGMSDVIAMRQMIDQSTAPEHHRRAERAKLEALLSFCETPGCRRQALLAYLGEVLPNPCGNCDTCLSEVERYDGTLAAQKALSAVYRTGQRFGAAHLIDVLRGESTEKVLRFGHEQLKTFGVGREQPKSEWQSVYRQLLALGLLAVDAEGHGFVLTDAARPVLKGERTIELRREPKSSTTKALGRASLNNGRNKASAPLPARGAAAPVAEPDQALWQALKACRLELARAQSVPPYVIFHDSTLSEMVQARPRDRDQFARLPGVGSSKLERYAEAFLAVIREHG